MKRLLNRAVRPSGSEWTILRSLSASKPNSLISKPRYMKALTVLAKFILQSTSYNFAELVPFLGPLSVSLTPKLCCQSHPTATVTMKSFIPFLLPGFRSYPPPLAPRPRKDRHCRRAPPSVRLIKIVETHFRRGFLSVCALCGHCRYNCKCLDSWPFWRCRHNLLTFIPS